MSKNKKKLTLDRAKARQIKKEAAINAPAVIELPDETKTAAVEVIEASDIGPGPSCAAQLDDRSSDLMQAATDPAAALKASAIDAEFDETDHVVNEILGTNDNAAHPIDVLFEGREEPAYETIANLSYRAVSDFGQNILDGFTKAGDATRKFCKQVWVRMIAFGNDTKDFVKMLGNKAWAAYDYNKKNPTWFYEWLKERQTEWQLKLRSKDDAIRELSQHILNMSEVYEKEMRRMSGRITDLETTFRKNTKALNRTAAPESTVDVDKLKAFADAFKEGRKQQAINLLRAMTRMSLAEAKEVIA